MEQRFSFSVESWHEVSYNGWTNLMGCCCQKHSPCSFLLLLATCSCPFLYGSFDSGLALSKPGNGETGDIGKEEKVASSSSPTALPPLLTMISHCSHPDNRTILSYWFNCKCSMASSFLWRTRESTQNKVHIIILLFFKKNPNTIIWEKSSGLQSHKTLATLDIIFIYHNLECVTLNH